MAPNRQALVASVVVGIAVIHACAPPGGVSPAAVVFDTATVWLRVGTDSVRVVAEVAESLAQQEAGLADRASVEAGTGMLFLFDPPRPADEGFWMWRTRVPLDVAFISGGVVIDISEMEPCLAASSDDCPGYFAEAPYAAALETPRGWLRRNGIGVGASVRVER
jgi:uncharacterized membrane protein (UPF0127 family)